MSKIKAPARSGPSCFIAGASLRCLHVVEGALIPFMGLPLHGVSPFQRPLLLTQSILGVRISIHEFWNNTDCDNPCTRQNQLPGGSR